MEESCTDDKLDDNDHSKLKFTRHAQNRKKQRDVTDSAFSVALQHGLKNDYKDCETYTDQNLKIVLSNDHKSVITVCKNTRNTNFLLSERTKQKEKSLLKKINKKNNDYALCELAELYLSEELGKKDVWKAYNLFERAAKKGNSHAMCKISQLYESYDLGEPNEELADRWMKKAADRNNVYALAITGQKLLSKYLEKYPVGSNILIPIAKKKEILYYLSKAADKGSTRGMWQLGNIYEEGLLGEQDLSKAVELYVKAAKLGSPSSLTSLHSMTVNYKFDIKELEEILDYVSSFQPTTSIGMAFELGGEQLIGDLGYNPVRGLKMIEEVALKQYDEAMLKIAKCYRDGVACDINLKLSQYWFLKLHKLYDVSAKNGSVISLWKLGKLYLNGNVGNIDLKKAESCFKEVIEKSSDPLWIYGLGTLYLKGRLGDEPIDTGIQLIALAIKIWQLQAAQGNKRVYFHIGKAYLLTKSHENAVYWLSKAPSDDISSQIHLARIYLDNSSSEKNISLGLMILESLLLEHDIDILSAFTDVEFPINDQTVCWLQNIADNIQKPIIGQRFNQQTFKRLITVMLAEVYETGQLGEINYNLASKYYYELFVSFESIEAGCKLVRLYCNQHLPVEYFDTVKNWVSQIPLLLETNEVGYSFWNYAFLLHTVYQETDLLSKDVKEATKWLYVSSYIKPTVETIKDDLANLPQLDYNIKEQIVSEISKMAQNMKITALNNYKVASRILGDIFIDDKIIKKNIDEAVYWYTESALLNNSLASFALGKIYQNKEDIETSIKWYMLSVQLGNKDALKKLTEIFNEQKLESLSQFLNKRQHKSLIAESKYRNINPLKNLQFYPKTIQEMYMQGKRYINSENEQYANVLNAAFWFRKAMKHRNIEAAIELHALYKSGVLGINLIPVANNLYLDILDTCCSKLKVVISTLLQKQNTSSILSLLNNVSLVLKTGNIAVCSTLNQKIEKILKENIDTAKLKDVVSHLELLKKELSSKNLECLISNALVNISISGEDNPSTSALGQAI